MLHFEVELEVAYELSSRLHYLITLHYITLHYITRFCFFFKKQPYIPSRKAVYVVEHVKKRTKHVGKKRKAFKDKNKKLSAPGFEPGSPKLPRVGKGSSIT